MQAGALERAVTRVLLLDLSEASGTLGHADKPHAAKREARPMNTPITNKLIPDGVDSCREIRSGNCYYVDKTLLIRDMLSSGTRSFLFTRPRRFGKSLNLHMLRTFFEKTDGEHWKRSQQLASVQRAERQVCRVFHLMKWRPFWPHMAPQTGMTRSAGGIKASIRRR